MARKFGAQLVYARSTKRAEHVQIDQHHVETSTGTQFIYQAGVGITTLNHRIWKSFLDIKRQTVAKHLVVVDNQNGFTVDHLCAPTNLIFAFLQMYFIKNLDDYSVYNKFVTSIDNIKRFNLDIESLFIQLRKQIAND